MASVTSITTSSVESLVQQYMALERKPITDLQSKKSSLNTQNAIFTDLKTRLQNLYNLADDLADTSNDAIFNAVQTSSSNTDDLTVSAGEDASQGEYVFRTKQLATSTTMKSTGALNTHVSTMSASQVVAGSNELSTDELWADAGFENTPDGTITINGTEFTLSEYETVDDFMTAVNDSAANANIFYDSTRDKFIIENTDGSNLTLSETGAHGFLTEANIAAGTYSSNVSGLESDAFLYEANFDTAVGQEDSGSFKINGVTFNWDANTDTLGSIISAINGSEAGVTAFYDDTFDRVAFTSKDTGDEAIQWEDVSGTFLGGTLKLTGVTQSLGQNAIFTINSTDSADEITKQSNTFTINGLNVTLKAVTVANGSYSDSDTTAVTVSSVKDETALKSKVTSFLNSYNTLMDYIRAKTKVDTTTYTRGALAGESTYTSLGSQITNILLGQVTGIEDGKPSRFSEIGITFGTSDMHATISDGSKLTDWLTEDPQSVADLFNSTNGVATRIAALIEPYTETYGIVDDRKTSITNQVTWIDERIKKLEERMALKEEYYRKQFTSLQEMLATVTYQQSTLTSLTNSVNSMLGLS